MKTLQEVLRFGDPASTESLPRPARLQAMKRMVLATPRHDARPDLSRRRFTGAAVAAAAIGFAAVVSSPLWPWDLGRLEAAIRFEIRLAEGEAIAGLETAVVPETGHVISIHPQPVVTNEDIAAARVYADASGTRFQIALTFVPDAAARLQRVTGPHVGRPVAVLLDGAVALAPVLRSPIHDSAWITGDYSREAAERIADGIVAP